MKQPDSKYPHLYGICTECRFSHDIVRINQTINIKEFVKLYFHSISPDKIKSK